MNLKGIIKSELVFTRENKGIYIMDATLKGSTSSFIFSIEHEYKYYPVEEETGTQEEYDLFNFIIKFERKYSTESRDIEMRMIDTIMLNNWLSFRFSYQMCDIEEELENDLIDYLK